MCDLRLRNPFSMLVAGSSQTGKTRWVRELLKRASELYSRKPGPVYFFHREWQPIFEEMRKELPAIRFERDMPDMSFFKTISGTNATVILDDLLHKISAETTELFTVGCSRYGVNIIFITQNLFDRSPHFRTISLNCKYFCIRKNPRDSSSILHFARQIMPHNVTFLSRVYYHVTGRKAFTYIFYDADQSTPENLRVRTNIFQEGASPIECFFPVRS